MKPNTKEFKQLQREWYKKLKKSGFEDIERSDGYLEQNWRFNNGGRIAIDDDAEQIQASTDQTVGNAKQEYYRLAGHFLYEHTFKTQLERDIWALHAEGCFTSNMPKILKKMGYRSEKDKIELSKKRIFETVNGLKQAMKDKYTSHE